MTVRDVNRHGWDAGADPLDVIVGGCVCDQCCEHHDPLVVVGESFDWETSTAMVCRGCLRKAMDALDAHEAPK